MDSWASLEHEMKYKHNIKEPERIGKELRRKKLPTKRGFSPLAKQ